MDPTLANFRTSFGLILGRIWGPKVAPKGGQKGDQFWNPLSPALRGPNEAISGNKREG